LSIAVKALGKELGRPLVLIAESDLNDPRLIRAASRGGYGLDAHWVDDFHHAIHRYFTGETAGYYEDFQGLQDVATALRDGYVYQGKYSVHRGRRHGRPPVGIEPRQLVVSTQNHDQIGNRAQGERLSMMLGIPQLKAIAALTLLAPFVPLLFQGEEWERRRRFCTSRIIRILNWADGLSRDAAGNSAPFGGRAQSPTRRRPIPSSAQN